MSDQWNIVTSHRIRDSCKEHVKIFDSFKIHVSNSWWSTQPCDQHHNQFFLKKIILWKIKYSSSLNVFLLSNMVII